EKGTAGEKGTGLGLTLVKELVELNKGSISIDSLMGKGSIFKVGLPLVV
ncbi:MAG: sensor histidine kinase, partial [Saprospiraceae bacterium]